MRWPGSSASRTTTDVAFANDPDSDRHGIVTPSAGLMNPNHYLAVAIRYLLTHRPHWPANAAVGKTLVSSSMIDRVVEKLGRRLYEVPVGFKWFVPGLFDGSCCFGGEESAGASFLRRDGTVWTTDKDGPIMDLLAAEITARTGKDPGEHYRELTAEFGTPYYTRIDAPATPEQKARLKNLSPEAVKESTLAGEPITAKLTRAPGNNAPIGGLKVIARSGWFAARPSGTENIYKIYAESFKDEAHLDAIVDEARRMVNAAVSGLGAPAIESGRGGMMDRGRAIMSAPFPPEYRASGVLLHVTSLPSPSRHRRSWAQRSGLDRPAGRCGPKLVAITATWAGGIWQLALSAALYLCRKRAAGQSGGSDRGRITAPGRLRRQFVLYDCCRLCGGDPVQASAPRDGLEQFRCWRRVRLAERFQ